MNINGGMNGSIYVVYYIKTIEPYPLSLYTVYLLLETCVTDDIATGTRGKDMSCYAYEGEPSLLQWRAHSLSLSDTFFFVRVRSGKIPFLTSRCTNENKNNTSLGKSSSIIIAVKLRNVICLCTVMYIYIYTLCMCTVGV